MTTKESSEQEWSDFQAKLALKSLDTISRLIHDRKTGKISSKELFVACNAMFDCISGLAPWETADFIYAVRLKMEAMMKVGK
jgi:hypothetical protein